MKRLNKKGVVFKPLDKKEFESNVDRQKGEASNEDPVDQSFYQNDSTETAGDGNYGCSENGIKNDDEIGRAHV